MKERRSLLSKELMIVRTRTSILVANGKNDKAMISSSIKQKPTVNAHSKYRQSYRSDHKITHKNKSNLGSRSETKRAINGQSINFNYIVF